jgi:hypothetical protein
MSDPYAMMITSTTNRKEKQMETKIQTPTVGSQFTTAKSGVTGEVKEVIKNQNGTLRVKLDVNGQDRWTTVK